MRRKKRYKHATIGKKKYYFYKIIWHDPCGDAGHAEVDEMKKLKPAVMCLKHTYLQRINSVYGRLLLTIQSLLSSQIVIVFQEV